MEEAGRTVAYFIAAGIPFDAIFAFSDVIALAAVSALIEAGRSVPGDVAVVGFDDIVLARHSAPPLTTVRQDLAMGARTMVDLLFERMSGGPVRSALTPVELVARGSSL
jgi:DNA-binding LacI/PurR family transcriptional regulator